MSRGPVHFHDGPYAGGGITLADDVNVLPVIVDGRLLGAYLRDPGSAGGRCMDWDDADVTYQDIPAHPASMRKPVTEGTTWHGSAQ